MLATACFLNFAIIKVTLLEAEKLFQIDLKNLNGIGGKPWPFLVIT